MSMIRNCKKCGAPLDLVRPAAIRFPCPECQAPLEIHFSPEGHLFIETDACSTSSASSKSQALNINQLDLFFHWEKVERSVNESLQEASLGRCPLCKGDIFLIKANQVAVECEYCGGKNPLPAEELRVGKKKAAPSLPATLLSYIKRMARPLDLEGRKRMVLRYLRFYRGLLLLVLSIILGLAIYALYGLYASR